MTVAWSRFVRTICRTWSIVAWESKDGLGLDRGRGRADTPAIGPKDSTFLSAFRLSTSTSPACSTTTTSSSVFLCSLFDSFLNLQLQPQSHYSRQHLRWRRREAMDTPGDGPPPSLGQGVHRSRQGICSPPCALLEAPICYAFPPPWAAKTVATIIFFPICLTLHGGVELLIGPRETTYTPPSPPIEEAAAFVLVLFDISSDSCLQNIWRIQLVPANATSSV